MGKRKQKRKTAKAETYYRKRQNISERRKARLRKKENLKGGGEERETYTGKVRARERESNRETGAEVGNREEIENRKICKSANAYKNMRNKETKREVKHV